MIRLRWQLTVEMIKVTYLIRKLVKSVQMANFQLAVGDNQSAILA